MKKLLLSLLIPMSVYAAQDNVTGNNNNVNICKPNIVIKQCSNCCNKPKVVEKIVEKPVTVIQEKIVTKTVKQEVLLQNHISLLGGYGPKGNLKESYNGSVNEVTSENGPVFCIQYMRDFRSEGNYSPHILFQIQTNRTGLIGGGVSF